VRAPDDDAAEAVRPARVVPDGEVRDKEILNILEASAFLGVSTKTFQKVLREGDMPGRKVGREWKFWRHALAEWVGRGKSRDFLDSHDRETPEAAAAPRAATAANGARRSALHRGLDAEED